MGFRLMIEFLIKLEEWFIFIIIFVIELYKYYFEDRLLLKIIEFIVE